MYTVEISVTGDDVFGVNDPRFTPLFPLERDIAISIYDISTEGFAEDRPKSWDSNRHWTIRVKEELSRLGRESGYEVYPVIDAGKSHGEWLFDVVWVSVNRTNVSDQEGWKNATGLKLACECEWTPSENNILEDFLKLTFVDTELRVFIYTHKKIETPSGQVHPVDVCKRVCPLSKGYRYLLLGVPASRQQQYRIDAWNA